MLRQCAGIHLSGRKPPRFEPHQAWTATFLSITNISSRESLESSAFKWVLALTEADSGNFCARVEREVSRRCHYALERLISLLLAQLDKRESEVEDVGKQDFNYPLVDVVIWAKKVKRTPYDIPRTSSFRHAVRRYNGIRRHKGGVVVRRRRHRNYKWDRWN